MPQLKALATALCVLVPACLPVTGSAQEPPGDAPRVVDEITFSPARSGSVLQATGNRLRCDLLSMTAEMVVVRNNQRTNEIEMDKIRSIRSTDGKFEYSPAQESFESLLRRCRRIQGVSLGKLEVFDDPLPDGTPPPRGPEDPARPGEQGPNVGTKPPEGPDVAPVAANLQGSTDGAPPGEGTEPTTGNNGGTAVCANCGKEIPPTLQNGDRCPHCQIIFWDPNRPIASGTPGTGGAAGNPPGPPAAVTPSGTSAQYPTGSGTGTAVAAPAPAASVPTTTTVGGTFSNTPMWMKVGLFAGMLAIVWLLLQRR